VFGSPYIPTPFDTQPPPVVESRGPGYEIQKPPVQPPARNPAPAAATPSPPPMMGAIDTLPYINSVPYAAPEAKAETPGFFERNKDVLGPDGSLWAPLGALGRGLAQPSWYGPMGQLSQGLAEANETARAAPMQKLQKRLLEAQVGEKETATAQKKSLLKQAAEIAKSLPSGHPARPYFALGLVEKGLEQLTPDYNKLIVTGPDGKPQLNATLMNAKAFIEAAGKWSWGVTGHDLGGKPIHGWVNPIMQGAPSAMPGASPTAMPGVPGATPAQPSASAQPPVSTAPRAMPAQATQGPDAVPPPPPGVDPYKWAEDQGKLRIQKQQSEAARQRTAPVIVADIDRALKMTENQSMLGGTTGFMGTMYRQIPGSPADNLNKLLDGVRANIGFDQLNQMRAQSPTGAALGQVTERELSFLQSVMGSLSTSQTKEQLQYNLKRLKNAMLDVIHGPGQGPARDKIDGASQTTKKRATRSGLTYEVEP
jgi:hypothetical protein